MRQTIINLLDILIWIAVGLIAVGGTIAGIVAIGQGQIAGLGIIVGALLYAVMFMGMFFIIMGIHKKTQRSADALEKLASG